jgi:hypothetical protein
MAGMSIHREANPNPYRAVCQRTPASLRELWGSSRRYGADTTASRKLLAASANGCYQDRS